MDGFTDVFAQPDFFNVRNVVVDIKNKLNVLVYTTTLKKKNHVLTSI